MDKISALLHQHYAKTFGQYGATAKGVDWGDENELLVRYDKILGVLRKDFAELPAEPSLLDVGCGWGGLLRRARNLDLALRYTGIDVVEAMVEHGRREFTGAEFIHGDVFALDETGQYDFVVCNAILTQKLSVTIPEMEAYLRKLVRKMFSLCRHGISFNAMSTRVNYMVDNLYYQNPADLMAWLLAEISPRVVVDHGYSSLASGKGKYYDFTVYVYKD
jgi:2-polyprenyl-3-methyl-5-hydroxy-6-metoxy-1,4-benzoquinol methylase